MWILYFKSFKSDVRKCCTDMLSLLECHKTLTNKTSLISADMFMQPFSFVPSSLFLCHVTKYILTAE